MEHARHNPASTSWRTRAAAAWLLLASALGLAAATGPTASADERGGAAHATMHVSATVLGGCELQAVTGAPTRVGPLADADIVLQVSASRECAAADATFAGHPAAARQLSEALDERVQAARLAVRADGSEPRTIAVLF
ncbi:MAG: hypothetical protein PVI30_15900 [Myxococcales bacterium]|jgi:hypothetical protein